MVIWLLGISGAGKTTLGLRLKEYFERMNQPVYMLDGDEARTVMDNDLGYSREDREANIKRIIFAGYVLNCCGINTIICCIAPFQHLRTLAKTKIAGYVEVYLKKKLDISKGDDVKGIYAKNHGKTDIVGEEIRFEEPQMSDLIIETDKETVDESLAKIIDYIETYHA